MFNSTMNTQSTSSPKYSLKYVKQVLEYTLKFSFDKILYS